MMNSCVLRLLLILMSNNAESICRKDSEKLRRSALHSFILHCGTKWARIARPNTLTDSYIRFLPEAQPYLNSMTRTPKSKLFFIALPCPNTLVGRVCSLITLLKYSLFYYVVELYPTFLLCCAIPNPNTLLRYTLSYYMAKQFQKTNTLLSYTQS